MEGPERFPYRFFVVTFLWSWMIWLPFVLGGFHVFPLQKELLDKLSLPALILAAFGPFVGAKFSLKTLSGKGALRQYLRGALDFRLGWKVWILPVLVSGGINFAAWILPELWGAPRLATYLPSLWVLPFFLLTMAFLAGGQEELGWRGYILDPIEARLGPWLGNVVLGAIWAVWHVPLFLTPGSGLDRIPFAGFMLFTMGYSWFFSWVREASGKRTFSGIYAHGLINAFGSVLPTVTMTAGARQIRYWIWASLAFAIGLLTMTLRSKGSSGTPFRVRSINKYSRV